MVRILIGSPCPWIPHNAPQLMRSNALVPKDARGTRTGTASLPVAAVPQHPESHPGMPAAKSPAGDPPAPAKSSAGDPPAHAKSPPPTRNPRNTDQAGGNPTRDEKKLCTHFPPKHNACVEYNEVKCAKRISPLYPFFLDTYFWLLARFSRSLRASSSKAIANRPELFGQRVPAWKVIPKNKNRFCAGRRIRHNFRGGGR